MRQGVGGGVTVNAVLEKLADIQTERNGCSSSFISI